MRIDGEPVLYMELPLVKDMQFSFHYKGKFGLIPFGGFADIDITEAYALATVKAKATHLGLLYPELHDVYVDFG